MFSPPCILLPTIFLVLLLTSHCSVAAYPPSGFVDASTVVPHLVLDMRYASFHNFVGLPIPGYEAPRCLLTTQAATALATVQSHLLARDPPLSLKAYDCYRPQYSVDYFVSWSQNRTATEMKMEFYPTTDKSELFPRGYIASRSGHSRGSTIDLTVVPFPPPPSQQYTVGMPLVPCFFPYEQRFHDNSLNFGTGFDCFSEWAHTNASLLASTPTQHRRLLVDLMSTEGDFENYPNEWWHFTLRDEPFPDTYFNFTIR